MLRNAMLLLLAVQLTIDILKRVAGLAPPLPRKLIYVRSFARRAPLDLSGQTRQAGAAAQPLFRR